MYSKVKKDKNFNFENIFIFLNFSAIYLLIDFYETDISDSKIHKN